MAQERSRTEFPQDETHEMNGGPHVNGENKAPVNVNAAQHHTTTVSQVLVQENLQIPVRGDWPVLLSRPSFLAPTNAEPG
jgi:hypothetical protein